MVYFIIIKLLTRNDLKTNQTQSSLAPKAESMMQGSYDYEVIVPCKILLAAQTALRAVYVLQGLYEHEVYKKDLKDKSLNHSSPLKKIRQTNAKYI